MKLLPCLLAGVCCVAGASAQLRTESVLPRKAAPEKPAAVYDSTANIRVGGDAAYYESLKGQRILFYPRDIHASLKPVAYFNFLAEEPAAVAVDTVWLRKPRRKVRPEDFRIDTVYSDVYSPRYYKYSRFGDITSLGCSLHEAKGIGTLDYSGQNRSGWFTPAEAVEGQSFEILGIEKSKLEDSELLMFRLRDDAGKVLCWFAHSGKDAENLRDECYPVVVEGLIEKYRTAYLGKDFFLTGRKPGAKGYTSSFGLTAKTTEGEEDVLRFDSEMHCSDVRLIGDGTGYAVPSFVFEKKEDGVQIYIPLTRYPAPFGVDGYMLSSQQAIVEELELTPSEAVYAQRAEAERQREEARIRQEKEQQERKAMLYRKYGKRDAELILGRQVRLGMTREMCREAWGSPEDINRSSGSWGVHEQWVYGLGSYLYFENGILSSIQN